MSKGTRKTKDFKQERSRKDIYGGLDQEDGNTERAMYLFQLSVLSSMSAVIDMVDG